jgi:hypothetical protein
LVRILAGTPVILPEIFRSFHQSLQANAGVVPGLGRDRFLQNSFQFIYNPTIRSSLSLSLCVCVFVILKMRHYVTHDKTHTQTRGKSAKNTIFWVVPQRNLEKARQFGGTYNVHLQDRGANQTRNQWKQAENLADYSKCLSCKINSSFVENHSEYRNMLIQITVKASI